MIYRFYNHFPVNKKRSHIYNKYGRLPTDFRRVIFKVTGKRFLFLDPYLRERGKYDDAKAESWFNDQYLHPHECKHTMGQVLKWFDETGCVENLDNIGTYQERNTALFPFVLSLSKDCN